MSVTCPNCQITTLVSLLKTKLVYQLVIKVGEKIATYTAFNDAVQSFLTNMKCDSNTALSDVDIKVLKQQLLHVGPQKNDDCGQSIQDYLSVFASLVITQ